MTTERSNVLAVMDAEVVTMRRLEAWVNEALAPTKLTADEAIARMEEARAAVAELIEISNAIAAHNRGNDKFTPHRVPSVKWERWRAALARVGGA